MYALSCFLSHDGSSATRLLVGAHHFGHDIDRRTGHSKRPIGHIERPSASGPITSSSLPTSDWRWPLPGQLPEPSNICTRPLSCRPESVAAHMRPRQRRSLTRSPTRRAIDECRQAALCSGLRESANLIAWALDDHHRPIAAA